MWMGLDSYSASTEDITNLSDGNYCVTVTDKLCGKAELCVTVNCEKNCPNINLDDLEAAINHPSECDASDGSIYFRFGGLSGGAPPYTITIYDEEGNLVPRTGQSWSGLSVGEYTILVEDANGCKGEFLAILLPEDGGVYLTSEFYPACEGQMNGSISVLAYSLNQGNGNTEFIYTWNTGQVFQTNDVVELANLNSGLYCVTVTSTDQQNKACDAEKCFTIEGLSADSPLRILSENYTEYLCPENNGDGYIDLTVTGGVPNLYGAGVASYSYNWNGTGGGGSFMSGLGEGIHNVVITDYCGDEISASYEIILFDPLSIFSTVENTCPKRSQGSILIEAADPDRELFYEWSNGETSNPLINLEAGLYSVTITDQNGCQLFDDFEIFEFETFEEPIAGTCDNNIYCSETGEFLYTQSNDYSSIVFDKDCDATIFCPNGEVINEQGEERLEDIGQCMFKKYCKLDVDELDIHIDEFIELTEGVITTMLDTISGRDFICPCAFDEGFTACYITSYFCNGSVVPYDMDCELIIARNLSSENNLSVYPNPFSDHIFISINFAGEFSGKGKVIFKDIYGSEILSEHIFIQKGDNEWDFQEFKYSHSSVVVLEVVLPDGKVLSKRLVLLRQ